MSNGEYLNKINFLKTLNSDFYVKKEKFNSDKIIYHKQIIVTSILKENHEENVEKFLTAAKGFYPQIEINFLNSNDILLSLVKPKETDKNFVNLILCDKDTIKNLSDNLKYKDGIYKSNLNKNIFLFNTLFVSDKITNDIKKKIWEDFKYIISL